MTAVVILGSVLAGVAGSAQAASPKPPKPVITHYVASPPAVPYTGGTVTVSATVAGASPCVFSTTSPEVTGLPATVACDSGTASTIVVVGNNTGRSSERLKIRLTADGVAADTAAVTTITVGPPPPKPTISNFATAPDPVPYTGGGVTLSASVTGATKCTFSSPTAAVTGLPATVACSSGPVAATVAVTANATTRTAKLPVELSAIGAAQSKVVRGFITLAPAPFPTITSDTTSPSPVSWTGGPVTLSATVANATNCTFSAVGAAKRVVSGLPVTLPCASGSASVGVTVSANHRKKIKTYTVKLTASGSGAKTITTSVITVSAITTPPSLTNFTSKPSPVASSGGAATLSANVTNAVSCTFSARNPAVTGLPVTVPCSVGTVSTTVTVPPNSGHRTISYVVQLTVHGQRKKISGTTLVTVAGTGHA